MPEGDTVWHAAKRLREALAGRVLTRSDFRVPRYATTDLTGRQVTESLSRGKHLLTRVEGGVTVHTHLKMEGAWRVRPAAARLSEGHRARLILANDDWQAVGYQLGVVEVLPTGQEEDVVGHLGPDLLGPGWGAADVDEAVRRLLAGPGGRRPRPCWTSATWPASATCTGASCCSCAVFFPGGRSARSATWPGWCSWLTGCWTRTRTGSGTSPPGRGSGAGSTGSTGGAGAPAAGAGR